MPEEKPPVFLPDYMVEDWGILPLPPDGYIWHRDFLRAGFILIEKVNG